MNEVLQIFIMYQQKEDVKEYIIQQLNDDVGIDQHISDLHHYLIE